MKSVSAGDLGFDVLLGGGFWLVPRFQERLSATVVVRGGAGAGKTLLGIHVALELAKALEGDVAVGCVEILPSEYAAQLESARPDLRPSQVVQLPGQSTADSGPRVFCGLLTELEPRAPDLVASLETLAEDVIKAGGRPSVFVVDSLSEGYGLGSSAPRANVDAVMKLAAQRGCGLVLCEEAPSPAPSAWVFAADTVLELGVEARERGRWLEVKKHRFGPSVPGRHEVELVGAGAGEPHPTVFPEPAAWVAHSLGTVLSNYGWPAPARPHGATDPRGAITLQLEAFLGFAKAEPLEGAFALVSSSGAGNARTLAIGVYPASQGAGRHLTLELDPLLLQECGRPPDASVDAHYVPTLHGPTRALRWLLARVGRALGQAQPLRRILLGDLGLVLSSSDALAWVEAVRVFAAVVNEWAGGVPLIAYDGWAAEGGAARAILAASADARLEYGPLPGHAGPVFQTFERWRRTRRALGRSGRDFDQLPLTGELASYERVARRP